MSETRTCAKRCGDCCEHNGLIPPVLPDDSAPEWLTCLVTRLRAADIDVEAGPCVFLTDDKRCAIYDMRPHVCREFSCEEASE